MNKGIVYNTPGFVELQGPWKASALVSGQHQRRCWGTTFLFTEPMSVGSDENFHDTC